MSRKLTYDEVKHFIEIDSKSGCRLISNEYYGNKEPLDILCSCEKNIFSRTFSAFKNKHLYKCSECNGYINWSYELAKQYIESLGYILVSTEYKNTGDKLTLCDTNGYYLMISLNKLQLGRTPYKFDVNNPYTIQNIKLWCKLNNKPFELVSDTYSGNKKYLSWQCIKENCKEYFEMSWSDIFSKNSACPYCVGKKVGLSNCVATKRPELIKEWHPTKNGNLTPYDVTIGCNKYAWWKCKDCGHEWNTIISNRSGKINSGCPECNKSKGEKKIKEIFDLNCIYYIPQKEFDRLIGLGGSNLSYDFYLPNHNYLIEYQGQFHDGSSGEYSKKNLKKQQEHDRRKREYAKLNNYNLLEIWYWDFDRIEEILDKELKLNNYKI